jgi:hypothetical protein
MLYIGKDLEGSGRGIIEVLARHFLGERLMKIMKNHSQERSGYLTSRPRFEPSIYRIETESFTS